MIRDVAYFWDVIRIYRGESGFVGNKIPGLFLDGRGGQIIPVEGLGDYIAVTVFGRVVHESEAGKWVWVNGISVCTGREVDIHFRSLVLVFMYTCF